MILLDAFLLESEAKIDLINSRQGDKVWEIYSSGHDIKIDKELRGETYKNSREFIAGVDAINEKYTQWVINQYVNETITFNQIAYLTKLFPVFDKVKRVLEKKDINQYKTFGEFSDAVTKADEVELEKSNRQKDKDLFKKIIADGGAKIVHKGSNFIVYQIETLEASMVLGRGTQWCTSADKNNAFAQYRRKGDIFIFVINGNKYQLWFDLLADNMMVDFMDATDQPVFTRHSPAILKDIINNKEVVEYLNTLADIYDADMIRNIDQDWWKSTKVKQLLQDYGKKFYELYLHTLNGKYRKLYSMIKDGLTDKLQDTHNIYYMPSSNYNSSHFDLLLKMVGLNEDDDKLFDDLYYDHDNYTTETDKEKTICINKNKRIGFIFAGPEDNDYPKITIFLRMD